MILIADSGSTKTTWMEVETGDKTVTEGLNPHFTTDGQLLDACVAVRSQLCPGSPDITVHFYGAGCGDDSQRGRIRALLKQGIGTDNVTVDTDMFGACRAVCGKEAALVGILGTGSNACFYDGHSIAYQAVSTGYILGDEGSANHVGRRLLQDYLSGVMPDALIAMFHESYPMSQSQFIEAVYHRPNPNRFLASLARFAVENLDDDYCSSQVLVSLCEWYDYQLDDLCKLSNCHVLNLVGGFAAHIRPLVELLARNHGLTIGTIVANPIEGLRRYHCQNQQP